MPAANKGVVGGDTVRMRSTGLATAAGDAGTRTSSIRTSPPCWGGAATSATRTGNRVKAFFIVLLLFLGWISGANGTRDREAPPDLVIRHHVSRPRNGRPPRWESNAVTPSGPLGLWLPEHIVGDFAVVPTLRVHATVRRTHLCGGLGVGGRVTRAVRIRSPGRLTYRAHADSARAGTRTGRRNQAQQRYERDPQELRSLIHSPPQLVRFGMTCTRICDCDADRGMRATQIDSFRKNSLGLHPSPCGPRHRPR